MEETLNLSLKQKLSQRLSPLQIRYAKLLEMNRVEVEDEVRKELDENPALEVAEISREENTNVDEEGRDFRETAEDLARADYRDEDDIPYYRLHTNNFSPDDEYTERVVVSGESLLDFLDRQLADRRLDDRSRLIARYVIGNIDDNGYLHRTAREISDDIIFQTGNDFSTTDVEKVIQIVRELEPAGIGAVDLRDCLLLQLSRRESTEVNKLAYKVVDRYFNEMSKKHYDRISAQLHISPQMLREVISHITSLNPKPASNFTNGVDEDVHALGVTPDFLVETEGNSLTLTLLGNIPELQIEATFADAYNSSSKSKNDDEAVSFIRTRYESASGFIKILQQRRNMLFTVMSYILKRQRDFFLTGDTAVIRPMILKDIAETLDVDISMVSRATAGKYVATQWGIFPLKFFFSEFLSNSSGEEISQMEIQTVLKTVIDKENKHSPFSDEQLCAIMRRRGYNIARRTIAKYREKLGIPVARLRKEL